jgi:hypothetical protein
LLYASTPPEDREESAVIDAMMELARIILDTCLLRLIGLEGTIIEFFLGIAAYMHYLTGTTTWGVMETCNFVTRSISLTGASSSI